MTDSEAWWNPLADVQRFLEELTRESPRAAAILAGVQLHGQLGRVLERVMIDDAAARAALLGDENDGERPLSTFSARIRAAYAFGCIPKDVRDDLDLIRRIRNRFAHGHHRLAFDDPTVTGWCNSLTLPSKMPFADRPEFQGTRGRFELTVHVLLAHLQGAAVSYVERPAVPDDLTGEGWIVLETPTPEV